MNTTPTPTTEAQFDTLLSGILSGYPARDAEYLAFLDSLSQRDRHLLVVQGLYSQVCNGGFTQWAENGYLRRDADTLRLALPRLRSALTGEEAQIVGSIIELIDRAIGFVATAADPEHLEDEDYEALDALDDRFYAISDRFAELMHAYFIVWA